MAWCATPFVWLLQLVLHGPRGDRLHGDDVAATSAAPGGVFQAAVIYHNRDSGGSAARDPLI